MRQRIRGGIARERRVDGKQLRLDLAGPSVHESDRLRLCLARGWACGPARPARLSGFTTQDLNRCQTGARACALVCNGWSWYCRAAHPTGRMEAITSRPLLLAAVGKAVGHFNQTTLHLKPLHGRADILKRLIANIGAALQHVRSASEQFKDLDRWGCLMRYISERIAPVIAPPQPPPGLSATG